MTQGPIDIREYNRHAWDVQVLRGNRWTVPVTREEVAAARQGELEVVLTPTEPLPRAWFEPVSGHNAALARVWSGWSCPIPPISPSEIPTIFPGT
jgi:hypothetical protein